MFGTSRPNSEVAPPLAVSLSVTPLRVSRLILVGCLLAEVSFVLLDYHVNYGRLVDVGAIRRLTNIAREDGFASWFGTTQTLLVSLTAWGIFLLVRAGQAPSWRRFGWAGLAAVFAYMAVDDGAQLHERFGSLASALSEGAESSVLSVFPSYAWQVLFVPLFGLFGVALVVFLWYELRERAAFVMVCAALVGLVAAVGLDFVEGLDEDHPWNLYTLVAGSADLADWTAARFGRAPYETLEHFSRALEEFLELFANTLLWAAFVRHLPAAASEVNIRLTS